MEKQGLKLYLVIAAYQGELTLWPWICPC